MDETWIQQDAAKLEHLTTLQGLEELAGTESLVTYLQQAGLLAENMRCDICTDKMVMYKRSRLSDGYHVSDDIRKKFSEFSGDAENKTEIVPRRAYAMVRFTLTLD